MALTLPYPSMNFVPLDVLTAEEMNHIVANYTFIANQFPLASSNIDWTTIATSGKLELGDILILWGKEDMSGANVWTDGTFSTPFASAPSFSATVITPAGTESNAMLTPRIGSLTGTGFRWAVTYSGGYGNNQSISWIAIGTKASSNANRSPEPVENNRGGSEEPSPEEPADENQR